MAKDPARPVGDERAEFSMRMVRLGAVPVAWIDHETGTVEVRSTATIEDLRDALRVAVRRWHDAAPPLRDAAPLSGLLTDFEAFAHDVAHDLQTSAPSWGATVAVIVRRLKERGGFPVPERVDFKLEGSIDGDPYAFEDETFARLLAFESRRNDDRAALMVRQRVLDDVHAAHAVLDSLDIPPGLLTARLALLFGKPPTFEQVVRGSPKVITIPASAVGGIPANRIRSDVIEPADPASVRTPDVTTVLADLDELSGPDLFRVFDVAKVLPDDADERQAFVLTDVASIADMVHRCCGLALERGRLAELAEAARSAVARKQGGA